MTLPTDAVFGSVWRVPRETCVEYWRSRVGRRLSDHALLQHGFCWLPRSDEHFCYLDCGKIDETPDKRIWRRHGLLELIEVPAAKIFAAPAGQPRATRYEIATPDGYVRDRRGVVVRKSHGALAPEAAPHVLHAEVIRHREKGRSLLEELGARANRGQAVARARVGEAHGREVVEAAQELLRSGQARKARIPMAQVGDDLVASVGHRPHRWAGER